MYVGMKGPGSVFGNLSGVFCAAQFNMIANICKSVFNNLYTCEILAVKTTYSDLLQKLGKPLKNM
jgi:hypothetical protein